MINNDACVFFHEDLFNQVKNCFEKGNNAFIHGESGAGKTYFANEIARRLKSTNKVYLIDCSSELTYLETLRCALNKLDKETNFSIKHSEELDFYSISDIERVLRILVSDQNENHVLIFDNWNNESRYRINECLSIILSQKKTRGDEPTDFKKFQYFEMKQLNPDKAEELIKQKLNLEHKDDTITQLINFLSEKNQLLPIFINFLASFLNSSQTIPIYEIITKFDYFTDYVFAKISNKQKDAFQLIKIAAFL